MRAGVRVWVVVTTPLLATIPTWALVRRSGVVTTTRTRTPARILDEELIIHD